MWGAARFQGRAHPPIALNWRRPNFFFAGGEFYRARKSVEKFLKKNRADEAAQILMAEIIDREIVRRKELFETKSIEEFTADEKSAEARTWLERARAFLAQ